MEFEPICPVQPSISITTQELNRILGRITLICAKLLTSKNSLMELTPHR